MRIAVIDLGTNTFNLLVCDVDASGIQTLHKGKIPVKLGEGGLEQHLIAEPAWQRGIAAMEAHRATIDSFAVDRIVATATSGIRSTANGPDFVREVKTRTNIDIEVIDGLREADLIVKGVRNALEIGTQPELIMDMGGGSTEFIIASNTEVHWMQSFKLGVSRIKEKFQPADPIEPQQVQALEQFLTQELTPLADAIAAHQPVGLIGCSGSFDSMADMIHHAVHGTPFPEHLITHQFDVAAMQQTHQQLLSSTQEQRLKMPGLIPFRADMMVLASLFINYIINRFGFERVRLSNYALKEGVIAEAAASISTK